MLSGSQHDILCTPQTGLASSGEHVFDPQHALVRDIERPDQLRATFESCQDRFLKQTWGAPEVG